MARVIRNRLNREVATVWDNVWNVRREERIIAYKSAAARLGLYGYIGFLFISVLGGAFTYPLVTKIFLNDWRFWRYLRLGPRLYFWMWRCLGRMLKESSYCFMFTVPLTASPQTSPDLHLVKLRRDWQGGDSCDGCTRCCDRIGCPMVDRGNECCRGYDSLSWRYFNCGRFPVSQKQLDFYQCPKWEMV